MKTKSNSQTRILVIEQSDYKSLRDSFSEYWVTAKLVKDWSEDLNPNEKTAWNGTLQLYADKKGQHYLQWHTGNSAHRVSARKVPAHVKDLSAQEAKDWI